MAIDNEHPETLEETTPTLLLYVWDQGIDLIQLHGWYILALSLVLMYYWQTIQLQLDKWYEQKSDKLYAAKCKKDPDWIQKRLLEMEAARKRMQEELDAKATAYATKMQEKKRAEVLAMSSSGGEKLGHGETQPSTTKQKGTSTPTKKTFRPEYNPLMGSGGSGGYRPPRRGCPGGGCG